MDQLSVSVVIPAYNAASTIENTIKSALNQTHLPIEVIVVDDGSSDDTTKIVSRFPAPVHLLQKVNGGPASARNYGARIAKGYWLAMLDADDRWYPKKLEIQLSADTSLRAGLIHCLANSSKPNVPDYLSFDDLWQQNWIINSSVLIKKSIFDELHGFNENIDLISVEDYNLWLRVAAGGWNVITCQEELLYYATGVGISSHAERFFNASIANIRDIGSLLSLPKEKIDTKIIQTYEIFGYGALYERDMRLARSLFGKALLGSPTVTNAVNLGASYLPKVILDMRRRIIHQMPRARAENDPKQTTVFKAIGQDVVKFRSGPPILLVVIDAEEEFEWSIVPSSSTSVQSIGQQEHAQRIFDRYGVVPTYAVDYPVASQRDGYGPLREFLSDGRCEIGAQLHPWVNPPIDEKLVGRNSFSGNLSAHLEQAKLCVLTKTIEDNFGCRPILYRAGRYGVGPNSARILKDLEYKIDCSVLPFFDLRPMSGPDYRDSPQDPYWCDPEGTLLEIPVTIGMTGLLSPFSRNLFPMVNNAERARLPAAFARLHLLDRVRLTPEGISLAEAKRLTRSLIRSGRRVLVISYHSPSLAPGNTPYVRSEKELAKFLSWIEAYLEFFFGEIGGTASVPSDVYALARMGDTDPPRKDGQRGAEEILG